MTRRDGVGVVVDVVILPPLSSSAVYVGGSGSRDGNIDASLHWSLHNKGGNQPTYKSAQNGLKSGSKLNQINNEWLRNLGQSLDDVQAQVGGPESGRIRI